MSLRDDLQMRLNHYRDGNHKAIAIDADECEQLIAELAPATGATKYLALNPMSQTPERWPVRTVNERGWTEHYQAADEWEFVQRQEPEVWTRSRGWFYPDAALVSDLVPRAELDAARADVEAMREAIAAIDEWTFDDLAELRPDGETRASVIADAVALIKAPHPGATPLAELRAKVAVLEKEVGLLQPIATSLAEENLKLAAELDTLRKRYAKPHPGINGQLALSETARQS
jgi:hypothetical protein